MSVTWQEVEDGEYNEIHAAVNDHALIVYSDRYGVRWFYQVDEGEAFGPWHTKEKAQREAINNANDYQDS